MKGKINKLVRLASLNNLLYGSADNRHSFYVDSGVVYELFVDDDGYTQARRAYSMDMKPLSKGKKSVCPHYIKLGEKYIKTEIDEYNDIDNITMRANEIRTKNFVVVYNIANSNEIKRVQVYSIKNGKLLLDLSVPLKDSIYIRSTAHNGIALSLSDRVIYYIASRTDAYSTSVEVQAYDFKGNVLKKATYNMDFKDNRVKVFFPFEYNKQPFIIHYGKNSVKLYTFNGIKMQEVSLRKLNRTNLWGNVAVLEDKLIILKVYNPESKRLEYFVGNQKGYYATKGFPLSMLHKDAIAMVKDKNYRIVVTSNEPLNAIYNDDTVITIKVFHYNKEIYSFKEKGKNYKGSVIKSKGKHLYIANVFDHETKLYKYRVMEDDQKEVLQPVGTSVFEVKNSIGKSMRNVTEGMPDYFDPISFVSLEHEDYYDFRRSVTFTEKSMPYTYIGELYREDNNWDFVWYDIKKQFNYSRRTRVYNDNAVKLAGTLFMKNKNEDVFFVANSYKVCCNKVIFNLLMVSSPLTYKTFLYDFKSRHIKYIDTGKDKNNVMTYSLNKTSIVHIINYKPGDYELGKSSALALYEINLKDSNPLPHLLFRTNGKMDLLGDYYLFKGNRFVYAHDEVPSIESYIQDKKIFKIDGKVMYNTIKDVKKLLVTDIERDAVKEDTYSYER
jgi:hypothetical protein